MAFNIIPQNAAQNWDALHAYVHAPYAHDAQRTEQVTAWFNDLYARRESDGITLGHYRMTAELTSGVDGRSFDAFRLGDDYGAKLFLSQDAGVLTVPHPSCITPRDNLPVDDMTKCAGIWLHHHPVCHPVELDMYQSVAQLRMEELGLLHEDAQRGRLVNAGNEDLFPKDVLQIFKRIEDELLADDLPGSCENLFTDFTTYPLSERMRFERRNSMKWGEGQWHPDETVPRQWARALLHTLRGKPTLYRIGEYDHAIVAAPPGSTISQVASGERDGILHTGQDDAEGRLLLLAYTTIVKRTRGNPWRAEPVTVSAPNIMLKAG